MPDAFSLLLDGGLVAIPCVTGWLHLRRRHRGQIDTLLAVHRRQIRLSAQRLAEAHRRAEILKREVHLLKKEIVQHQSRWLRIRARSAPAASAALRPATEVRTHEAPSDDSSGFPHTQPWERDAS